MSFTLRARVAGMLALTAALANASPARADTLTVTQLQDDGPGSLREAVAQANATPGADTIRFGLSGTVTLLSPLIVSDDLLIDGAGQRVTLSGSGQVTLLVQKEPAKTLDIARLTLRQANASQSAGGAIHSRGNLRITESLLLGNTAPMGGAVYSTGAQLVVVNSTFARNRALSWGGAIAVGPGTQATITYSTFVDNDAADFGGALFQNPIYDTRVNTGSVVLRNTVISGSAVKGNCSSISNRLIDGGGNLNSDSSCPFSAAERSANHTNAQLGELAWHGGPTMTYGLQAGSPAIDSAIDLRADASAPATDQRGPGYARAQGPASDRGAFELQPAERTALGLAPASPAAAPVTGSSPAAAANTAMRPSLSRQP